MSNGHSEYFQGKTEANIKIIFENIEEIKGDLADIKQMLQSVTYWKAKVSGIAIGCSAIVSIIIKLVHL